MIILFEGLVKELDQFEIDMILELLDAEISKYGHALRFGLLVHGRYVDLSSEIRARFSDKRAALMQIRRTLGGSHGN